MFADIAQTFANIEVVCSPNLMKKVHIIGFAYLFYRNRPSIIDTSNCNIHGTVRFMLKLGMVREIDVMSYD